MKLKTETRSLPCKLTYDEVLERGGELATAVQDLDAEETRQTNIKAELKARLTEIEARRNRLANVVSRREEYRDVQVDIIAEAGKAVAHEIRLDTGEVIRTRPLEPHEKQRVLPLEGAPTDESIDDMQARLDLAQQILGLAKLTGQDPAAVLSAMREEVERRNGGEETGAEA